MSGVSANCYATKWHLRRGSNRNDGDDQKSRPSKPSGRANLRASDRVFGLWFVFARGSYARPPVSVALPRISALFRERVEEHLFLIGERSHRSQFERIISEALEMLCHIR